MGKIKNDMQDLYDYLQIFNSPEAPQGEGARDMAAYELIELGNKIIKKLDKSNYEIIVGYLIEIIVRVGLDFIDRDYISELYEGGEE